jgi:hypothetical protein
MSKIEFKSEDDEGKAVEEVRLAVQEWGIKNDLRLLGTKIAEYEPPGIPGEFKPMAKSYFVDTDYKNIFILYLGIKKTGNKFSLFREKMPGTKWAIKIARTKNFDTGSIDPIFPLYWVLVDRGIILPFRSMVKNKKWAALPFEDDKGIKKAEI